MRPSEHMNWFARSLLLFNRSLLRQLPAHYNIRFDPTKFLESLTFTMDDHVQHLSSWELAPDPNVLIPSRASTDTNGNEGMHALGISLRTNHLLTTVGSEVERRRQAVRSRLCSEWYPHVSRGIPSAAPSWPEADAGAPRRLARGAKFRARAEFNSTKNSNKERKQSSKRDRVLLDLN